MDLPSPGMFRTDNHVTTNHERSRMCGTADQIKEANKPHRTRFARVFFKLDIRYHVTLINEGKI